MIVLRVFGIMDLLTALAMVLGQHDIVGARLLMVFAAYISSKAFMFKGDFASLTDLLTGVYIIFMMLGLKTFIVYILAAYLVQKGIVSLI